MHWGTSKARNLESLQGVLDAAEATQSPVIIGFNGEFLSRPNRKLPERLQCYAELGRAAATCATVPCGLIFNECPDDRWVRDAVLAGFNLVMPADPNASYDCYSARVAELTRFAHRFGVAVEAEIGRLPSGTPVTSHASEATDPELAARFVRETDIDLLAVSVGNVHVMVRKQNLKVDLAGCLGRDAAGEVLVKELQAARVNCDQLVYAPEYPTSETIILLVEGEDRRYLHSFGANQAFTVKHIARDWLAGLDVFYLGGLFAMPGIITDELVKLLAFAREQKVVTVVDVVLPVNFKRAAEMEKLLPFVDWFLPNNDEGTVLTGKSDPLEAMRVFRNWGGNGLVVTSGEQGAVGAVENSCWRCSAYPSEAVDPSGAGDAFASGIITGIVRGWDFPRTLRYSSALGASATRAVGTTDGVLTGAQAERFVAEEPLTVCREILFDPADRSNTAGGQ